MRAALLIRPSAEPMDEQLERLKQYCLREGIREWEVVVSDASGPTRVVELAEEGEIQAVIATRMDVAFRSLREMARITSQLELLRVSITTLDDNYDSPEFLEAGRSVAKLARNLASQRSRESLAAARERGVHLGRPPVGWKVEGGKLVPDEERMGIVREIHAMRESGLTLQQIADQLNARGVDTGETPRARLARERRAARKGEPAGPPRWHRTSIARALKSPVSDDGPSLPPLIEPL